jgi:ADP-ribosylglycohydrolase
MAAIDNLRRGVHPPLSGQHVHGWSDGLAMRVAPLGIVAAGDPQLARRLAEADGAVSHSGEGILAGVVVAVAVAVAMAGAPIDDVVDAAIAAIPTDSWTSRNLRLARRLVASCSDSADLARTLYERLAALDYYWADLGPEAVGLAFAALIHGRGEFRASTLFAVNLGRDSDTNAAIAGCVSGALSGISTFPPEWVSQVRPVAGSCLRSTAEMDPLEVAEKLADLVTQRSVTA